MELRPGYKQTELGVIPLDWEVKQLGQISPKQGVGLVINPSTYFDRAGTVPLLVGSHVSENYIDATTANRISPASNNALPASRLSAGDLVTVRVGEPGVTAVVPMELDGCNCASMMIVRKHASFDSGWLCAAMNSWLGRRQVEGVQYGTAQKQFNISDAIDFKFGVPALPEQRAIAEALSDVDALLGGLDRLIAKKRDLKQAAMQQLLTGQTRLPGFSGHWSLGALGDVVSSLEAGVSVNSTDAAPEHGVPCVLKTSALVGGIFLPDEAKVIVTRDIVRARATPERDTILISRMNTPILVGEIAYVPRDFDTLFLPDRLWMARFSRGKRVNVRWMAFVLCSWAYRDLLRDVATGTSGSMKNISKSALLSMPVRFPSHEEQTAIAAILSDMDAELIALEARRDKTRAVKQAMMQELLTGRTRLV